MNHTKTHAVLSYVLRVGYFEAIGFLESVLPFQQIMAGDKIFKEEGWKKCLTHTKAILKLYL